MPDLPPILPNKNLHSKEDEIGVGEAAPSTEAVAAEDDHDRGSHDGGEGAKTFFVGTEQQPDRNAQPKPTKKQKALMKSYNEKLAEYNRFERQAQKIERGILTTYREQTDKLEQAKRLGGIGPRGQTGVPMTLENFAQAIVFPLMNIPLSETTEARRQLAQEEARITNMLTPRFEKLGEIAPFKALRLLERIGKKTAPTAGITAQGKIATIAAMAFFHKNKDPKTGRPWLQKSQTKLPEEMSTDALRAFLGYKEALPSWMGGGAHTKYRDLKEKLRKMRGDFGKDVMIGTGGHAEWAH